MRKIKSEPLISVIVPVYKVEKYIERCLDSIINQSYNNIEIILVDDGSPDECPKICDNYAKKDKRIKVIHKKNGGLSDARNSGIEKSNGEYLFFVDSDDWIHKDTLKILYLNLIENNADIACCKMLKVYSDKNIKISKKYNSQKNVYTFEEYTKLYFRINTNDCYHYVCDKLYKRNVISEKIFPVGLTSEDVVGMYKILLKTKIIVEINYPYYYYYQNPYSITGSKFSLRSLDMIKVWEIVLENAKQYRPKDVEYARLNLKRTYFTILVEMAMKLDYSEIKSNYNKEFKVLLKNVKKDKKYLLKSSIPYSRKIMIIIMCFDFRLLSFICKQLSKVKNIKERKKKEK